MTIMSISFEMSAILHPWHQTTNISVCKHKSSGLSGVCNSNSLEAAFNLAKCWIIVITTIDDIFLEKMDQFCDNFQPVQMSFPTLLHRLLNAESTTIIDVTSQSIDGGSILLNTIHRPLPMLSALDTGFSRFLNRVLTRVSKIRVTVFPPDSVGTTVSHFDMI